MLFYNPLVLLNIDLKISLATFNLFVLRLNHTLVFYFIKMSNTLQAHYVYLFLKSFVKIEKKQQKRKRQHLEFFFFSLVIHFSSVKVMLAVDSPYSTMFL